MHIWALQLVEHHSCTPLEDGNQSAPSEAAASGPEQLTFGILNFARGRDISPILQALHNLPEHGPPDLKSLLDGPYMGQVARRSSHLWMHASWKAC